MLLLAPLIAAPRTISCTTIEPTPFPCAMIKPKEEDSTVLWLVDEAAADKLNNKHVHN